MNTALNVECGCGQIHRMEIDTSTLCQCGATVRLVSDSGGGVTPWANSPSGKAPQILGFEGRQIYKPQQSAKRGD